MYSEVSGSSISSFFSATSNRRETLVFVDDDDDDYGSGSDTATDTSRASTISSPSITLAFNRLLGTSYADDLLSVSLSISTVSSCASFASISTTPPFSRDPALLGYSPFVNLTSSPFIRSERRTRICSEDLALNAIISAPTAPRLKNILMEKLYVAGWADKIRSFHTPDHIPWQFSHDECDPMPWIPEGSLVSKDRFYEVRRQTRPKSYSPPPSPPCEDISSPADPLPFPSLTPEPQKKRLFLKRSSSFHPGGSWRIRREALVIDGKVSVDDSNDKKRRFSQLPSSSSEPNKLDMLLTWQKMNALHERGLEGLKKFMVKLMKEQESLDSSGPIPGVMASNSSVATSVSAELVYMNPRAERASHSRVPLASRSRQKALSTITVKKDTDLPPLSYPEVSTPHHESPSTGTSLVKFAPGNNSADRGSMDATVMCDNLRSMMLPLVSPCSVSSPGCLENRSVDSAPQHSVSLDGSTFVAEDEEQADIIIPDEWDFANDLHTVYGDDPFLYFTYPSRHPQLLASHQHSRPLSVVPEVLLSSPAEATSNSVTPSHSTLSLQQPGIPEIVISTEILVEPQGSSTPLQKESSTSCEDLFSGRPEAGEFSEFHIMTDHSIIKASSPEYDDEAPRTSREDEDRLFSSQRQSLVIPSLPVETPQASAKSPMKRIQGILKPIKTVRFASSASEHVYPAEEGSIAVPSSHSRSPKQSSLRRPSPLRNECVVQTKEAAVKSQNNKVAADLLQPSNMKKKNRFSMIPLSGRLSPMAFVSGVKQNGDAEERSSLPVPKKTPLSMIPVTGRRSPLPLQPLQGKKLNNTTPAELPGRPLTPASPPLGSRKVTAKSTPKSHGSWTSNLRKYGNSGQNENEMRRQGPCSPTKSVSPTIKPGKAKTSEPRTLKKPSPPMRFAGPAGENRSPTPRSALRAGPLHDEQGLMKSGAGIGFIAAPRAPTPYAQRAVRKENREDRSIRDSFERHKLPTHLRTILGRLTG